MSSSNKATLHVLFAIFLTAVILLTACGGNSDTSFYFSGMKCSLPLEQTGLQSPRGVVDSLIFKFDAQTVFVTNTGDQGNTALLFDPKSLYGVAPEEYIKWIANNRITSNGHKSHEKLSPELKSIDVSAEYNSDIIYGEIDNRRHVILKDEFWQFRGYEWCDINRSSGKKYCELQAIIPGVQFVIKFGYTLNKSAAGLAYAERIATQFGGNCAP